MSWLEAYCLSAGKHIGWKHLLLQKMFGCAIYGARGSRSPLSLSGFRKTYIKKTGITFLTGFPHKTDVSLVFNKGVGVTWPAA